jgi:hypothetical protein
MAFFQGFFSKKGGVGKPIAECHDAAWNPSRPRATQPKLAEIILPARIFWPACIYGSL